MRRQLITLLLALVALAASAGGAAAAPTVAEFPIPGAADADPQGITLGPDGRLYFTQKNAAKIGRITPGDPPTIESFELPQSPNTFTTPHWITTGPDGNIWFSAKVNGAGGLGRLLTASPTDIASFGGFGITGDPGGVATGFDNNIWVVDPGGNGRIVRVNPATGQSINADVNFNSFAGGRGLARGPDGNMWAASFGSNELARIPANGGSPTELAAGGPAWAVTAGPDGNVWYTVPDGGVGRMNPATGDKTVFPPSSPAGDLFGIAVGPDGALWAARAVANDVARATTDGSFSFFSAQTAAARPEYIALGPDNTLWFTEKDADKVGRITGIIEPDPGPGSSGGGDEPGGGETPVDAAAPLVTGLAMTDRTVVVGQRPTLVQARTSARTGTTIRYTLSEPAGVVLRFQRARPRRLGGKRYRHAGTLRRSGNAGRNAVRFSGRIGTRALRRGRYRLVVTATDAAGNVSARQRVRFRVVGQAPRR